MDKLIASLGSQSPIVILSAIVFGIVLPKFLDLFFKSKSENITAREQSLSRLSDIAEDLYIKMEKLGQELDLWKDKYYQLQKDFNQLEATHFIAMQKLRDSGITLAWPAGSQELSENKHEHWGNLLSNCPLGIHLVAKDGTILWANNTEISLLNYDTDEYIGKHISYFHADEPVILQILETLTHLNEISSCPARLKMKDGSLVHVLINSNVYTENGIFVHTRCFTSPITEDVYNYLRS